VHPGPAGSMPSQIVVWTDNFKIEVLSSRTGRMIRTLATNVAVTRGIPTLAVSPAGVVYFDDARGHRNFVLSVPLTGGPVTTVADGNQPALSPDGRQLAYWINIDHRALRQPEAIVVRDLPAGTQKTWPFTSYLSDITSMSWSPDGRSLAFADLTYVQNGTVLIRAAQVLDTRSGGTLDGAQRIPLGRRVAWAGFLTSHTGAGVLAEQHGPIQTGGDLVEVGIARGQVLRRLTSLPPQGLATVNSVDGTEGTITVDRTGSYLLIAGMGTGTGEIFRWTFGMPHPVEITSGALHAVWAR
jgi:WD40-like Beta Propeller Repeat